MRKIGDIEIEEIIAKDLTRGQIRMRYGVGEHAAQLARTRAVAIAWERSQARQPAAGLDLGALHEKAEEWLAQRATAGAADRIGTDRSKVTLFLDWLEDKA